MADEPDTRPPGGPAGPSVGPDCRPVVSLPVSRTPGRPLSPSLGPATVPPTLPAVGPRRLTPGDPALDAVLALIRASFAYMDGVVDPPSSVHRLGAEDLAPRKGPAEVAAKLWPEVWVIGDPVIACMVLTVQEQALYLGKLAVAPDQRGRGLSRVMVEAAVARARELGLGSVELQTRVELAANQATFAALGFDEVARTAHPGYLRPTSITYRRLVGGPDNA